MGGCPAGFRWLWLLYSNSNKIDKVIIKKNRKKTRSPADKQEAAIKKRIKIRHQKRVYLKLPF